jgi:hypothetical protein
MKTYFTQSVSSRVVQHWLSAVGPHTLCSRSAGAAVPFHPCAQAVVAKVYKSLIPHQAAVGYSMAPAKSCLSQKPVAAWDLEESLQTAVIKTLTGCSSGTPTTSSTTSSNSNDPVQITAPAQAPGWMCLSRRKLLRCNLLAAAPGQVSTAPFVELEVKHDAASKGLLLMVHAAGGCVITIS